MKHWGVPAALASGIVGRIREETIVDGCLSGRFGEPNIPGALPSENSIVTEEARHSVRLKELEIRKAAVQAPEPLAEIVADITAIRL
jgi:hypothetical protein